MTNMRKLVVVPRNNLRKTKLFQVDGGGVSHIVQTKNKNLGFRTVALELGSLGSNPCFATY